MPSLALPPSPDPPPRFCNASPLRSPSHPLSVLLSSPSHSFASADAYRLPGQGGNDLHPALRPLPPHAHQPILKEDDLSMDCNDDYQPQAPPVQTNFIPKATEQPQPRTLLSPRGAAAMSLSPSTSSLRSRELPDLDTNIDPTLRPPVAAPASRLSKVPHLPPIPPSTPVVQNPQVQAQQMMLPRPPHHSPYHLPLLPHQRSQTQVAATLISSSRHHRCRCRVFPTVKRTRCAKRPPRWLSNSNYYVNNGQSSCCAYLCNSSTGPHPTPPTHAHAQPIS